MSAIINRAIGFEMGSGAEASSTTGTPDFTEATIVNAGGSERSLKFSGAANQDAFFNIFDYVASGGGSHILGFAMYIATGVTPSSNSLLLDVNTDGPDDVLDFQLKTDGNLQLTDTTGIVFTTTSNPFTADTWHYVEFFWRQLSSSPWAIMVDGVIIGESDTSGNANFNATGLLQDFRFFGRSTLDGPIYFDDVYWMSGITDLTWKGIYEGLGKNFKIRGFQPGGTGATDTDEGATPSGNWSSAGQRAPNDSNTVSYLSTTNGSTIFNDTNSGGASPGPSSASGNLPANNEEIVACEFWHRMERGNGQNRTHRRKYGNSGDGVVDDTSIDATITTAPTDYFTGPQVDPTILPLTTEDFQMGFGKDSGSGQDSICYEMMAMIAWVDAPTPPSNANLDDGFMGLKNSFHGPFEKS